MGYTKQALKGVSWLGAFRIFMRCLSYLKIAIIARILTPAQYGVSDIALLILSLVEVLTETGINIFLIQETDDADKYINTAWIVSIARGILITLSILITAPIVSSFFNSPESRNLLIIISVVPLLRGFINPSVAKFLKDLQFNKEFYYRSSIFLTETLVMIIAVLVLHNPIGIIWGLVAGAIYEVIISFIIAKPNPSFKLENSLLSKIFKRGKWLTAAGILNYLYQNIDNIFIGKLLGTSSLGLYQRSYSLSMVPMSEITDVFAKATFPIYVKIAKERRRLLNAYLKTIITVTFLVIIPSVIFYLFPKEIIYLILGEQWIFAAEILKVLAFLGALRAIITINFSLFYSLQRQDAVTKIVFISLAGLLLTIIPFINIWGAKGAGYAALTGSLLSIPVLIFYLIKVFASLK